MKEIIVKGGTNSQILIGQSYKNVGKYLPNKSVFIITDDNLHKLYADEFPNFPIIRIPTGEKIKTLETLEYIVSQLIELEADRNSFILGIGGGLVCDIAGFVASIYMRGIDFGFISTSLLSQVDASVGGKNGVNFNAFKNILGTFRQAKFVICDYSMFKTLPQKEFISGLGELLKYALISDAEMYSNILKNIPEILSQDEKVLSELIFKSIDIKARIVETDEQEKGERKLLNFGHTIGHAIENQTEILHGEAVALGMIFASHLSLKRQLISEQDFQNIKSVIQDLGLPSSVSINKKRLIEAIRKDKKKNQFSIDFILLKGIGKATVESILISEIQNEILIYDFE